MRHAHRKQETPPYRTCCYCGFTFTTDKVRITRKYCSTDCRNRYNNLKKKEAQKRWTAKHPTYFRDWARAKRSSDPEYYVLACRRQRLKNKLIKSEHKFVWGQKT